MRVSNSNSPLPPQTLLVVGDSILDIYHHGTRLKTSSEGNVLIGKDGSNDISWGGAALLVRNILVLGGRAIFLSLHGDDEYARHEESLENDNLTKLFVTEAKRSTTVKERFLIGKEKVLKWNRLDDREVDETTKDKILSLFKENVSVCDKVIISDYRHGMINKKMASYFVSEAKKAEKPIYVDSQVSQSSNNHAWYKGADLFVLNLNEAKQIDSNFSSSNPETSHKSALI